jgi:hypothetical protein
MALSDLADGVAGGCASKCRHEHTAFESYLAHIQLTAAEPGIFSVGAVMWGRLRLKGVCFIGSMRYIYI